MIKITAKRVLYAGLIALFFYGFVAANFASAAVTYERDPAGSGNYDEVTFSVSGGSIAELCVNITNPANVTQWAIVSYPDFAEDINDAIFSDIKPISLGDNFTIQYDGNYSIIGIAVSCYDTGNNSWSYGADIEGDYSTTLYTTLAYVPPISGGNSTWGEAGIFGSTSMIAAVGSGVVSTGSQIWSLFVFLGVALAFVIALQVVVFSNRSFGTPQEVKNDPVAFGDVPEQDQKAYKRGKKELEKDYPSLYK